MVLKSQWPKNAKKRNTLLLIAFLFLTSFIYSQTPVAEVYSGRIHNSKTGNSFYLRILDVTKADFESYYAKSQQFILFNTLRNGYSDDYKIGAIYYSASKEFTLTDIQSLLKELGFSKVKYDDAIISVNELPGKPVITPESNQRTSTPRN